MLSFWRNNIGAHINPVIFFLASLSIGVAGLVLSFQRAGAIIPFPRHSGTDRKGLKTFRYGILLMTAILCLLVYKWLSPVIDAAPIDAAMSDIIPQTQVLTKRFLQHQFPYQTITEWGYPLFPTYQPMQWLPFTLAELTATDYRKFALILMLLAILGATFFLLKKDLSPGRLLILSILPFIPILGAGLKAKGIYQFTLENLIAAYYLVFCISLFSRSVFLIGLAMVCCLLSRYSIVLWVPLFLFMLYSSGEKKKAGWLMLICFAGVLLIYVLPFFRHDTSIFIKGYRYHTGAAIAEWKGQGWQAPGEKPIQLFRGLGFAGIFYDYTKGSIEEKLKAFQLVHLIASISVCLLLGLIFYWNRHRVSLAIFALASLKIYLAVFYHFIQIPYDYLFLTLIYVSIPIIWMTLFEWDQGRDDKGVTPG